MQVGIAGGEPACGRDRLVEGGVDAAGGGVDKLRQRVDVGAFQLGKLAVLQQLPRERVSVGQLFQDLCIGARAGLRSLDHWQAELVKEHLPHLHRRTD